MDRKALIARLHSLFCEEFKKTGKYATVWLSGIGSQHNNYRWYNLHVVPKEEMESNYDEIVYLNRLLNARMKDDYKNIRTLRVHYLRDRKIYGIYDYVVFEHDEKCSKCENIQMQAVK